MGLHSAVALRSNGPYEWPPVSANPTTRRHLLEIGGLSMLGLGTGDLLRLREAAAARAPRARSCVFVFLFGAPATSISGT
ncbi:MAG: hypothetical protein Ct9H300mP1_14430 [Planctomycetaceae bacterium]|nr:MAG: hypothetical protein Ct9H300mP1_14430 [Planctomycetaceae bacterium]